MVMIAVFHELAVIAVILSLAVSYTMRDRDARGGSDIDDYQLSSSVGMELVRGRALDLGYKIAEEDNVESQTVGFRLAKSYEFTTGD